MKKIAVVGSINMDIVSNMQKYPLPGETIHGSGFGTFPGGKGANQAVAAGRLGGNVVFLGMVGGDIYGADALNSLKAAGVDTSHIEVINDVNTGVACIWVNGQGENCIVLDAGANGRVDVDYIKRHISALEGCDTVLMQFEIPMETVHWVARYCKKHNISVILDPAPATLCEAALLSAVDYVTPNETELLVASGEASSDAAVRTLLECGAAHVLCKEGGRGCTLLDASGSLHSEGFKVKVVDTTAAGDSFNAGFAVALARGYDMPAALAYANAVGALAVTGFGAQSAMPADEEVIAFMEK